MVRPSVAHVLPVSVLSGLLHFRGGSFCLCACEYSSSVFSSLASQTGHSWALRFSVLCSPSPFPSHTTRCALLQPVPRRVNSSAPLGCPVQGRAPLKSRESFQQQALAVRGFGCVYGSGTASLDTRPPLMWLKSTHTLY